MVCWVGLLLVCLFVLFCTPQLCFLFFGFFVLADVINLFFLIAWQSGVSGTKEMGQVMNSDENIVNSKDRHSLRFALWFQSTKKKSSKQAKPKKQHVRVIISTHLYAYHTHTTNYLCHQETESTFLHEYQYFFPLDVDELTAR